jgi:hypothetical protein
MEQGRVEEANEVVSRLDPRSAVLGSRVTRVYVARGERERARQVARDLEAESRR